MLFLFIEPLDAHTIYLKSGKQLIGKIIEQNKKEIIMEINGKKTMVQKSDVDQVDYFDTPKPAVNEKQKKPEKKTEKLEKPAEERMNRWDIVGRSALIPGWGHYVTDHSNYAATYLGLNTVALSYSAYTRNVALKEKASYSASARILSLRTLSQISSGTNPGIAYLASTFAQAGPYNKYQSKVATYNNSLILLGIAYFGQLIHAYSSGINYEEEGTSLSDGLQLHWQIMNFPEMERKKKTGSFAGVLVSFEF